jgi:serine/threonine-protein kinase HipA
MRAYLPSRKYQSTVIGDQNGSSPVDILKLLAASDQPAKVRADFFKSQLIFWPIGATDGHGKNFSLSLHPGGGLALTPFYGVLSAQPTFDKKQIPNNRYKLAMSVGANRKYKILEISGRHFVETGHEAGFGKTQIRAMIDDVLAKAPDAAEQALARMPKDFEKDIHESVAGANKKRLPRLEQAVK